MNFLVKIAKKGGIFVHKPPTNDVAGVPDVVSGARWWLTWRAGLPRGATRHWGHVAEPEWPTQGACGADVWSGNTWTGHADAREGRHVARGW